MNGIPFNSLLDRNDPNFYWWRCGKCGDTFLATIGEMIKGRKTIFKGCPYCSGQELRPEESFGSTHQELLEELSTECKINPYTVHEFSHEMGIWKCKFHPDRTWKATFFERSHGRGGCPICKNFNYAIKLKDEFPEFKKYFDEEKNIRTFESYAAQSNEHVYWKCSLGHSFEWAIYNFTRNGIFSCKICDGTILIPGVNDLQHSNPELAAELKSK